jgi:hypothetical protein
MMARTMMTSAQRKIKKPLKISTVIPRPKCPLAGAGSERAARVPRTLARCAGIRRSLARQNARFRE